jgi:hypothetical protein
MQKLFVKGKDSFATLSSCYNCMCSEKRHDHVKNLISIARDLWRINTDDNA